MNEVPLDQLSAQCFAELVRTKFQVLAEPGVTVSLELTTMTDSTLHTQERPAAGSQKSESFSLLFDGPPDRLLSQRTYRFAHERLGWFDLFIVPVSAERGARQYEAVFNRQTPPTPPGAAS